MATIREMQDQLADAGDDIGAAASRGANSAEGELHKLGSKLRANGSELEDNLRDAGERFAQGAKTLGSAAGEQVREHPLAAAGIAFAAGVLVSRWLRSR